MTNHTIPKLTTNSVCFNLKSCFNVYMGEKAQSFEENLN